MFALAVAGDGGVRLYSLGKQAPSTGGGRGEVCGFSQASRRRLIDKLMLVPWKDIEGQTKHDVRARAVLVTLTYPAIYPVEGDIVKRHLANFRRALEHVKSGAYAGLWRLEYQKRGAAHFHILLWFKEPVRIASFVTWARETWYRVVGSGDVKHLRHGVDVRPVTASRRRPGALLSYLVKYLGKVSTEQFHTGRIWGTWGAFPQEIRCAATFETYACYVEFLRRVRRWGKRSRYLRKIANCSGLRLFCYGTNVLFQLAQGLAGCDVYIT